MNRGLSSTLCFFCGCLSLVLSSGCGARPHVTYYNLTSLASDQPRLVSKGGRLPLAIGLGPVTFPEALSRAQIAARLDPQRLQYSDVHRWSGSLVEGFSEVLLEDLAAHLPEESTIALFPWDGYFRPTHRLVLQVARFDGALAGEVVLTARWTITNQAGQETLLSRQSMIHVPVGCEGGYDDLVTAQSQAVADLAQEIAGALAGLGG